MFHYNCELRFFLMYDLSEQDILNIIKKSSPFDSLLIDRTSFGALAHNFISPEMIENLTKMEASYYISPEFERLIYEHGKNIMYLHAPLSEDHVSHNKTRPHIIKLRIKDSKLLYALLSDSFAVNAKEISFAFYKSYEKNNAHGELLDLIPLKELTALDLLFGNFDDYDFSKIANAFLRKKTKRLSLIMSEITLSDIQLNHPLISPDILCLRSNAITIEGLHNIKNAGLIRDSTTIDISHNTIESTSFELTDFFSEKTKNLNISSNKIELNYDNSVLQFNQLETLYASSCKLSENFINNILTLNSLKNISLAETNITYVDFQSILSSKLEFVDVSNNNFSNFNHHININTSLKHLDISSCHIKEGTFFDLVFEKLLNLKCLIARFNSNTNGICVKHVHGLEILDISGSEFIRSSEDLHFLNYLPNLKVLIMNNCNLNDEHINVLSRINFTNLEVLSLSENNLTHAAVDTIKKAHFFNKLHEVNLSYNDIKYEYGKNYGEFIFHDYSPVLQRLK